MCCVCAHMHVVQECAELKCSIQNVHVGYVCIEQTSVVVCKSIVKPNFFINGDQLFTLFSEILVQVTKSENLGPVRPKVFS